MNPSDMRDCASHRPVDPEEREQSAARAGLLAEPAQLCPCRDDLTFPAFITQLVQVMVFLLFLLVGTNTGWDEWPLPFLGSASLRLLSTLPQPSARCLTADASSAGVNICQMPSLPPRRSGALCSLVPFVCAVRFQSLCVV